MEDLNGKRPQAQSVLRTIVLPLSLEVRRRVIDRLGSAEHLPFRRASEARQEESALRGRPVFVPEPFGETRPTLSKIEGAKIFIFIQILSIGKNRPIEPKSLTTMEI
jgi:hypothetical protein